MKCPNCGKENLDSFRFCQYCGTLLTDPPPSSRVTELPLSNVSTPSSLDAWLIDDEESFDLSAPPTEEKAEDAANAEGADSGAFRVFVGAVSASDTFHTFSPVEFLAQEKAKVRADASQNAHEELSSGDLPVDIEFEAEDATVSSPVSDLAPQLSQFIEPDARQNRREARICRRCGEALADGHRFCGNCGSRYDEGDERVSSTTLPAVDNLSKRTVERVSFVAPRISHTTEKSNCGFVVHHVNDDGSFGDEIAIHEGENFIGRASSPNLGADRYVNPRHLRLMCTGHELVVEDANSLNGVFLKISNASVELRDGDVFRVGEELLSYFHGSSVQALLTSRSSEKTSLLGGKESPGWGYLRVVMGAFAEGCVYRLSQEEETIGRTHANILFPRDGFVSGTHASLRETTSGAILTDLNSSNGTFVRLRTALKITKPTFLLIGNQLLHIAATSDSSLY